MTVKDADLLQPTSFLVDIPQEPQDIPCTVTTTLDLPAYEAALHHPVQCNLQLLTAAASDRDLTTFPARLPASDACAFSPVLKARLENWTGPGREGVYLLDLQVNCSQELLNNVVTAVYGKSLKNVSPGTAEAYLMLASYLQVDWLLTAMREYISEKLLPVLPLGVYKLSCHNSELRLLDPAAEKVVQQRKPKDLAALIELTPADGSGPKDGAMRLKLFRMIAKKTTLAQCVAFLDELMGETSVRLQEQQAAALQEAHPALKSVLAMVMETPACEWHQVQPRMYRALFLACDTALVAKQVLVWEVPFQSLDKASKDDLRSPGVLKLGDGRRFALKAVYAASDLTWGVFAAPVDGSVWHQEDHFQIGALKPWHNSAALTFAWNFAKNSDKKKVTGQAIDWGWKKGMDDLRSHYSQPASRCLAVTLHFIT